MTNYPNSFDDDTSLFLVRDAVNFVLLDDYQPGQTTLYLDGTATTWSNLPATGIVTLTDQCSDLDERAISFFYAKIASTSGAMSLTVAILPGFVDVAKPKRRTKVTMNVMSQHHNRIKDALIAIENFIGIQGTLDSTPLGTTMEGRINFLRQLVLSPKANFSASTTIGLVPLTVSFTDLSFRLGDDGTTGEIVYIWDFGDGTTSSISMSGISNISTYSNISDISLGCDQSTLIETNQFGNPQGTTVQKTYCEPGIYNVTLTVSNKFGSDSITLPSLINARIEAPQVAEIEFVPNAGVQLVGSNNTIRTPTGTLVTIEIPPGADPGRPGFSYAGEPLNSGGSPIDPIASYTWSLDDDLSHNSLSSITRASYSIGGLYNVIVRVDTEYGAYRITTLPQSIDVVENKNLWLFNFTTNALLAQPYEFGLISETFKTAPMTYTVDRDNSFLSNVTNSAQQLAEFNRNVGFAPIGTTSSGDQANALLFYASGRSAVESAMSEQINFVTYNGFSQVFSNGVSPISRPWNWVNFNSSTDAYFLLGEPDSAPEPFASPTNPVVTDLNMGTLFSTNTTWTSSNFLNGSNDLLINAGYSTGTNFNDDGTTQYGDFSTYRAAWKDSTGFILRNNAVGDFFRIQSFYSTQGTLANPVSQMTRLQDMPGPAKLEGELLSLASGLYFFNNTGALSAYDDIGQSWTTGGPGVNSASFRSLQDQTVSSYDSATNTLVAASDGDQRAYLSYDYSPNAFIMFNAVNLSFSSLTPRPAGTQWVIGIY